MGLSAEQALNIIIDDDWEYRLRSLPEFATSTGDHRYDDRLDDRSLAGYAERIAWAEGVLAKVAAWSATPWPEGFGPSNETRVSARLLMHHCKCVVDGGKAFAPFLCPINRLEGPQVELPQLVAYMKFETLGDYQDRYLKRLAAVPQSLTQVTDLLKEGVRKGMLPPLCGLEGVVGQVEAVAADLRSQGGKGGAMWRPCPASVASSSSLDQGAAAASSSSSSSSATTTLETEAAALLSGSVAEAFDAFGCYLEVINKCYQPQPCMHFTFSKNIHTKNKILTGLKKIARVRACGGAPSRFLRGLPRPSKRRFSVPSVPALPHGLKRKC